MSKTFRCAIYTRKSTEEGLDQAFNSLHAQREACEAYVLSQKSEGWKLLPALYDDGGFSGGSMERPALVQLLADVEAGKVDVVVVYKVDRLTRSLSDFARIVDVLDRAGASFVSVTQAFNTTTSMGRLTLNVLLSFAQFEREVTGERIRDKIAASKKKGMWMGGTLPLGYAAPIDLATRALIIIPQEAELVRAVFARYLELGSMNEVMDWLEALGQRTRVTTSRKGKIRGGVAFGRGALNHLLKNRHYLGEIVHKGVSHQGAHPAIVDVVLFEAVQQKIAANTHERRERPLRSGSALLKGLLFDAEGEPMSPSFGYGKSGRLYRYYVSAPLQQGKRSADDGVVRRVSAPLLEETVRQAVLRIARAADDAAIRTAVARIELDLRCITVHLRRAAISKRQNPPLQDLALAASRLLPGEDAELDADATLIRVRIPVCLRLRGGRTWLTQGDAAFLKGRHKIDPVMTKALRQAHALVSSAGVHPSRRAPVPVKGPDNPYHRKLAPLAFLSPAIQRAILEGRQPAELTLNRLIASELPLAWNDQERLFGL